MIEPFFFSNERLFGIYQASSGLANSAVVICPPAFDEYRRSYRALSSLATACSQLGYDVLRFDYRGTGDSKESISSILDCNMWIDDIRSAIDEVLALTGYEGVKLVGVRLGALLASNVQHSAVSELIAWDPVVDGTAFVEHWDSCVTEEKSRYRFFKRYIGHNKSATDYRPFELDGKFLQSLKPLSFNAPNDRCSLVLSGSSKDQRLDSYSKVIQTDSHYDWPVFHDGLIHPRQAMEGVVKLLGGDHG